jgi:acyl-CoA thioesterase-1
VKRAVLAACLLLAAWPAKAATPTPTCPPMSDTEPVAESLPHLAAALKPGGNVDMLVIGTSAATPGLAPAGPATSSGFVQLLGQDLQAAIPGLHVSLMARGGRGQDASAQLDLIRAALKQHRYTAVLWQTGTLDAVRSAPADTFYQSLSDGADLIAEAGADLVLVEPQYSRFLEANADLSPYLAVMQSMDAARATLVFHRYDLMHAWADASQIDLEHATRADRTAIAARLQSCLAGELAHAILVGARGEALR